MICLKFSVGMSKFESDVTDSSWVETPLGSGPVIVEDRMIGLGSSGEHSIVQFVRSWASSELGLIVHGVLLRRMSLGFP